MYKNQTSNSMSQATPTQFSPSQEIPNVEAHILGKRLHSETGAALGFSRGKGDLVLRKFSLRPLSLREEEGQD